MTTGASSVPSLPVAADGPGCALFRRLAHGDDLERFWPSRRMDAFDEHCR